MADDPTNNAPPAKKTGDSPWDEPAPEEPKPQKAEIVGTLEPGEAQKIPEEKPGPFNIPKEAIEEKVGAKVPAENFIKEKPASEAGVTELIKPSPTASQTGQAPSATPRQVPITTTSAVPGSTAVDNIQASTPRQAEQPKPVTVPATPLQTPANTMGQTPPTTTGQTPPAAAGKAPPTAVAGPPAKKSFFDRFKRDKGQNPPGPPKQAPIQEKGQPKPPSSLKTKLLIAFGAAGLIVIIVVLTELGVISIGAEKLYGAVGIESLWGGLPKSPEKALGVSLINMQSNLNFKVKGTITVTANKNIKSNVLSPLLTVAIFPVALKDQNMAEGIAAILTDDTTITSTDTSDPYSSYYNSTSDTSSTSSSTSDQTSTSTDQSATSPYTGSQTDTGSYQAEEATVKEIKANFDTVSGSDGTKTDFEIQKITGASDNISLITSGADLFVKASEKIKYAENADPTKWLSYKLAFTPEDNIIKNFAAVSTDSGLSISGNRVGDEKISGISCFHYQVTDFEIGNSLSSYGITSDLIQKMSGDYWIGVDDKLLHKVSFTIIPSISSSASRVEATFEISDYGTSNSIDVPILTDTIEAGGSQTTTITGASTTTGTSETSYLTRDQQRKTDLATIKTTLEAYKTAKGRYPVSSSYDKLNSATSIIETALVPAYAASLPKDPNDAQGWYYGYKSDGKTFTLSARLENTADSQVTKVGDIYLHFVYSSN